MSTDTPQFKSGVAAAAAAYFCWGLFPIFWKLLDGISSLELMAHRIVWCAVTMFIVMGAGLQPRFWSGVPRRTLCMLAASALLIAVNWWVYIWAIGNGKIVEGSLGYFINPLVNVVFGVIFLHERLNRTQWTAVGIAAAGVAYLAVRTGALPWIALALAFSFGSYGLLRKLVAIDAPRGLAIESAWLLLPALGFLFYLHAHHQGHFGQTSRSIDLLILCTGPISAVPLLLFTYGARRIPLSLIGILQYIGPTLQFLSGVLIYHEPFDRTQLAGFGLIWLALVLYTGDGLLRRWNRQAPAAD
jgi:chloramphenicol-sensitive protein RarD